MCSVLVVEDNVDIASSLAIALELDGHVVETANDGASGLMQAATSSPRVVVLDVGLPKLDGVELARGLRQMHGDSVHLIAYTAQLDEDLTGRLVDAGVDDTIMKAAPVPELLEAVRRWS